MGMVVPSWVEYRSLAEAVRARALATPARELYTFLENGEEEGALHLTWGELDRRARALARALRDLRAAGADGPALLLCPPGLDFPVAFFGCLLAGVPAVPVYPPGSRRHLPRLRAVARDARPAVALTTSAVLDRTAGWLDRDAELPRVRWIAVDRVEPGLDDGWEPPAPDGGDLAFLQYTSGSTADPRGVRVGHANLLHNLALIRDACGHDESSVFVSWLPLFHDLGLIGNLLQAAFVGARAVLMAPTAFLQRPARWLEAVSRYGATTSGGPDFAYELCVRRIAPAERERLDLSRWRVAFNGAEPVRAATLARFAEAFAPCGFRAGAAYPCYGLAEATLMVSGGRPGEGPVVRELDAAALERGEVRSPAGGPRRALVGCGRPLGGQTVAVVDPATGARLGPGRIGEIWLAGPSVAGGYWGRPEETAAAFGAVTADGEGPFLRTGDLGFLDGGELFVAGRLKDLIVLRGRNLYPQDVELAAERGGPELAPGSAAAFAVEAEGEERLAVVVELPRRWAGDPEALAAAVRRAVAEELEAHVREVVLVPAGALPRTSSGKVQRRRCRSLLLAGELPVTARSAPTEGTEGTEAGEDEAAAFDRGALLALPAAERRAALGRLVAGRVARALRATAAGLAPGTPLAGLGLDSMAAIELRGDLADLLGAAPPVEELLAEGATLGGLAAWAERALDAPPTAGEAEAAGDAETITELPLAFVQEALWVIQRLAPEGTAYHVPFAARLPAGTDAGALARALRALLDRHAALATTFHDRGGVPVQRLGRGAPPALEAVDAAGWSDERLAREIDGAAHRPFDLERGPLARACLFHRQEGDHLLLAFHHLVIDGWSLWRLLGELGALYAAESAPGALEPPALPAPGPGYGEFVRWQRRRLAGEEGERLWRLWRPRLAGVPPLELPVDLPRAPAAVRPGGSLELRLGAGLGRALRALAASRGVTLFTLVLAAFQALLYRWTGQEEFLVGVAAWGRSRPELEPVVGCCFNVVPVPAAPSARLPFGEHLRRVQREARASIALQDLPSHLMAERLPAGEAGLFQVTFLWQKPQWLPEAPVAFDPAGRTLAARGLVLEPVAVGRREARQELELEVVEAGETLLASFHYDAGLFRAATVHRLAAHLESLLCAVVAGPDLPLGDLPLLGEAEAHLLAVELSGAGDPEAPVPSVLALLGERLRSAPAHLAAAHPRRRLTYGQLDRRSAELAALIGRLEP